MKEELISLRTAKLAKEKGFNPSLDVYNDVFDLEDGQPMFNVHRDTLLSSKNTWILRPTQSLLQKWLREIHNIHINIDDGINGYYCYLRKREIGKLVKNKDEFWVNIQEDPKKTYEKALEKGLQEAFKLI